MKKIVISIALIVAAALPVETMAQKKETSKIRPKPQAPSQKLPCANAQTQIEMNRCARSEYDKADAELNKVYQEVLQKLQPDHQERLKIAQRAWLPFRDAHCDCEAFKFDGGSMQPLVYFSCLGTATRERIKQLREMDEPANK